MPAKRKEIQISEGELVRLKKEGHTIREIASRHNLTMAVVHKRLIENGMVKKRGNYVSYKKSKPICEEKRKICTEKRCYRARQGICSVYVGEQKSN